MDPAVEVACALHAARDCLSDRLDIVDLSTCDHVVERFDSLLPFKVGRIPAAAPFMDIHIPYWLRQENSPSGVGDPLDSLPKIRWKLTSTERPVSRPS